MTHPPAARRIARRWFGIPRWIVLATAAGLVVFAAVYGPWTQPSAQVRTIVTGLRSSSVYQAPGAPGLVNAARARQVIGNRPIVAVILDRTPLPPAKGTDDPRMALCERIAEVLPTDYVWVYGADGSGKYKGNNCYGPDFPHPTKPGVGMDDFDLMVNTEAGWSAQFRMTDTDLTPQLEEFVLTFDEWAGKDYGAVPTRGPEPDTLATQQIVLAGAGMVAAMVTLFLLLRFGGLALHRRTARAAARRERHAELSERLSRIADAVINPREHADPDDARRQADVAKRYVLALDQLEHAHTDDELAKAGATIGKLAKDVAG